MPFPLMRRADLRKDASLRCEDGPVHPRAALLFAESSLNVVLSSASVTVRFGLTKTAQSAQVVERKLDCMCAVLGSQLCPVHVLDTIKLPRQSSQTPIFPTVDGSFVTKRAM
eukprot:4813932-Amphidinium_carterae.1